MNLEDWRTEYNQYKLEYRKFAEEIQALLERLNKEQLKAVDIVDVRPRPNGIKSFASLENKITRRNKKYKSISYVEDIAGVRVVCHCSSDVDSIVPILETELKRNYQDVERKLVQTRDGYRGVHFIVKKEVDVDNFKDKIMCEVQVRTALQDVWAIQSHKYFYKEKAEGDANILVQTVSGILNSCENLWELVKKSAREKDDRTDESLESKTEKVKEVSKHSPVADTALEKLVSEGNTTTVEDRIEKEHQQLVRLWEKQSVKFSESSPPTEERLADMLSQLEDCALDIVAMGLFSIKHDRDDIFDLILEQFSNIALISDNKGGFVSVLSLPAAILHNPFYYFGVFALKRKNGKFLRKLIEHKLRLSYHGSTYYSFIWSSGAVFAPEMVRGADKMFDRLRARFQGSKELKEIINVSEEDFLNLACQFNLLFCVKAAVLSEDEKNKFWAYPNFGRFYSLRVRELLERVENENRYQSLIRDVFDEEVDSFKERFDQRLRIISSEGLGAGYFWESISGWDIRRDE